jgi:hypothetical protein
MRSGIYRVLQSLNSARLKKVADEKIAEREEVRTCIQLAIMSNGKHGKDRMYAHKLPKLPNLHAIGRDRGIYPNATPGIDGITWSFIRR